jgi:hypothetical protein
MVGAKQYNDTDLSWFRSRAVRPVGGALRALYCGAP